MQYDILAINGGEKTRQTPMPSREAFGDAEVEMVNEVVAYYRDRCEDPPYEGVFEKRFCEAFVAYQGGGYADAVSSGTASLYVALAALELEKGSEVIISPVTDSGPLNAIILLGLIPVVADAAPKSFNSSAKEFAERITDKTSAILAVHTGGEPLDMEEISKLAKARDIKLLEDCSQATGASIGAQKIGTFGDIAAFSTMYRKNLAAGASGGIVYTKNLELYRKAIAHADRGKQPWRTDINQNDPGFAMFPALNFNTDEFSCAIGLASLRRLDDTISKRLLFLKELSANWNKIEFCELYPFHDGFSPFFHPVIVDVEKIKCSKIDFAKALAAEGVSLNLHYGCVIDDWEWARSYCGKGSASPNARWMKENSFNVFLNEKYEKQEALDIVVAICKVEKAFKK